MTDLPMGWSAAPLGELVAVEPHSLAIGPFGSNLKVSDYEAQGVPLIFVRNIRARDFDLVPTFVSEAKASELSAHHVAPGDVLITKMGDPPGDTAVYPSGRPTAVLTADCIKATPHRDLSGSYIALAIESPSCAAQIAEMTSGVAQQKVSLAKIRGLSIPVAPDAEQERIVVAIEEAFSKLDAGEVGLRTVRQLLKRMRDAILAAAVTGRLVPQDPTDTPATKLLADLGIEPVSDSAFDVPPTWAVVRLTDLLSEPLANGRSVRSREGGFPVLRLTCLVGGRIDLGERKAGEWDATAAAPVLVRKGDFFVSRGNGSLDLVGRGGLVVDEPDPVAYPDTLIRVRVPKDYLEPSLLALVWNSAAVRQQLEGQARTTAGIYKVNQGMLNDVRFPLPPREEQARIVSEVERQMSFVEGCERAVDAGLERSAALRRSVLKAAFEGRLVPQDPTDEPASVLLERIRAERAAAPKAKTRRAKTKS